MHDLLATERLKTGDRLDIECVKPPDDERKIQVAPFLAHKPANYCAHIDRAFAGQTDDLETYFYIGLINGDVVGNIMTVEVNGVGILGHVHTRSDHRRKGVCSAIMRHQMEHFRQRDGRVLLLGTGYQSAAYHIYASFGFRDWSPHVPGRMRYDNPAEPEFESRFFAPAPCEVVPAGWKHWPLVGLIAASPGLAHFRSFTLDLWGTGLMEGAYSRFLTENGPHHNTAAFVLESQTGAVIALTTIVPDPRCHGDVRLVDLIAHPCASTTGLVDLLGALPETPMHCYADPIDTPKITALESMGFARQTVLPRQFRYHDAWCDLLLYSR